jgi:hypothetical protein
MKKTSFVRTAAGILVPGAAVICLFTVACLAACGRKAMVSAVATRGAQTADSASGRESPLPLLSKEEVGAILGRTVTSVEGALTDMGYKTGVVGLEVTVGIERENDAQLSMSGARKATGMLGCTPVDVPNLGEEAFFGAMSVLYVRRGDLVITITPPNLQLVADDLGAMAAINSSSKTQGMNYETQARAIGVALAAKVVAKL